MTTVGFSELDVMMVEFMMQFQKYMNVSKKKQESRKKCNLDVKHIYWK